MPSNFERVLAANLKLLTENGQLLKVISTYSFYCLMNT